MSYPIAKRSIYCTRGEIKGDLLLRRVLSELNTLADVALEAVVAGLE
jgi:hypothetical protein